MQTNTLSVTYRHIGLNLCAIDCEIQWRVLVGDGKETLGPEGGNEVFILQTPVEAEHFVEVQSQAAAVVHQDTQLLPLENQNKKTFKSDTGMENGTIYINTHVFSHHCCLYFQNHLIMLSIISTK